MPQFGGVAAELAVLLFKNAHKNVYLPEARSSTLGENKWSSNFVETR